VLLISILIAENTQKELPSNIKENIDSFRAHYPGFEHQLFDRAACQEIISKNFDREVLAAFEKLKPFAFQSDLARLCILYQLDGVYADLSVYFF
jgi:mannosyltransferase OCH1-like enzyme